jgi:hypothetical protein
MSPRILSRFGRLVYWFRTGTPPPPCCVQNTEHKGLISFQVNHYALDL